MACRSREDWRNDGNFYFEEESLDWTDREWIAGTISSGRWRDEAREAGGGRGSNDETRIRRESDYSDRNPFNYVHDSLPDSANLGARRDLVDRLSRRRGVDARAS